MDSESESRMMILARGEVAIHKVKSCPPSGNGA